MDVMQQLADLLGGDWNVVIFAAIGVAALIIMRLLSPVVPVLRSSYWLAKLTRHPSVLRLNAGQQDLVSELGELGFAPLSFYRIEHGPHHCDGLLLQRPDGGAFAFIAFAVSYVTGYSFDFFSFTADGKILLTVNREPVVLVARVPDVIAIDAFAGSLVDHWKFHQARMQKDAIALSTPEKADETLKALVENSFPLLIAKRDLVKGSNNAWHPSPLAALRLNWRMWRTRSSLLKPYDSRLMSGPHRNELFARGYELTEAATAKRPPRNSVTAGVLIVSLLVSLAVWINLFDLDFALILVAVLLVHEAGHALAMRMFGYRDISMFFIPLIGAAVTGTAEQIATWKEAIILLAGPLPGLLAAVAYFAWHGSSVSDPSGIDWQLVAIIAGLINLANLLPISPLDGGRLLEIAVFNRWPTARLAFTLVSLCALLGIGAWMKDPFSLIFVAFFALLLPGQWRLMILQRAWRAGRSKHEQLLALFETARSNFGNMPFVRQYLLIKAVFIQRKVLAPKFWESSLVVLLMVGLWSSIAATVLHFWPRFLQDGGDVLSLLQDVTSQAQN